MKLHKLYLTKTHTNAMHTQTDKKNKITQNNRKWNGLMRTELGGKNACTILV